MRCDGADAVSRSTGDMVVSGCAVVSICQAQVNLQPLKMIQSKRAAKASKEQSRSRTQHLD